MKTKILSLAMILAFSFTIAPKTNAATNWADYFTKDEASSIKKMVDKYIRGQIDDDAKNWKGVIGKKQVDDSIAKQKVYTGTITASSSVADYTFEDGGEHEYWKKISVPELDLSDDDLGVKFYSKVDPNDNDIEMVGLKVVAGELWQDNTDSIKLADKYIWVNYGDDDDGSDIFSVNEYKIIMKY